MTSTYTYQEKATGCNASKFIKTVVKKNNKSGGKGRGATGTGDHLMFCAGGRWSNVYDIIG